MRLDPERLEIVLQPKGPPLFWDARPPRVARLDDHHAILVDAQERLQPILRRKPREAVETEATLVAVRVIAIAVVAVWIVGRGAQGEESLRSPERGVEPARVEGPPRTKRGRGRLLHRSRLFVLVESLINLALCWRCG